MTLEELLESRKSETITAPPSAPVDPMSLPWWVVVLSKKPTPDGKPRAKFVCSFSENQDAVSECERRTAEEAERIATVKESGSVEEPFQFFVIVRPHGGKL